MKVEIYSDVVCPWCYIGERRFARALEEFEGAEEVEVVFRAYQLDPSAPDTAVPLKEYLSRRFGSGANQMLTRVTEAAAGEGIAIEWDDALSVNTLTAHRLLAYASLMYGAEVQRALAERLFDLHFSRGGDLADIDTLTDLAREAGMDAERARAFLASDDGKEQVEAEIDSARSLGISAVPTFVFDGQFAVQGAQPVATFVRALEEVTARTAAGTEVPANANDEACEDDACLT